jgi:NADPH2:quinone reductase
VGRQTFDASLDALAVRGTMVLFGASSGPVAPLDPQVLNRKGSLSLTRPSLPHFVAERAELEWRSTDVFELVRSGRLDIHIGAEFPLAEAGDAHRALEGRQTTGKVLLLP